MWIKLCWIIFIVFLDIKCINYGQTIDITGNTSKLNTTEAPTPDILELLSDPQFVVSLGGTGLTVICFILLVLVLCCLSSLKKRLVTLEEKYTDQRTQPQPVKAQTSTQSNSSNYADDVNSIPQVSRRSEYIRQKVVNEFQNFRKRVSRTITLFNTPRSSADTFDLEKPDDPIYDDIPHCRPAVDDNYTEKGSCWCLCCKSSEYKKARTSDPRASVEGEKKIEVESKKNEQLASIEDIIEVETYQDKREVLKRKKRQKEVEQNQDIEVKHVEFDEREIRIQPTTTDDVAIKGYPPKTIRQVNQEHQLSSFGKKSTVSNKQDFMQKSTVLIEPNNTGIQSATMSRIQNHGMKLPVPSLPLRPTRSLPSVYEEPAEETSDKPSKDEEPIYMAMSQKRIDPAS